MNENRLTKKEALVVAPTEACRETGNQNLATNLSHNNTSVNSATDTITRSMAIRSQDGNIAGCLKGDVFVKVAKGSRHQLRKPPAWAVDASAFDQIRHQARLFRIIDTETDRIFEVSIKDFDQYKGVFDRGFGRQYFLPLARWNVIEPDSSKPRQLAFAV